MEINFDKIKTFSAVTVMQVICGVIIPGFLFLYVFNRELFLSLDLFRLSVIAISISFPLMTINGLLIMMLMDMGSGKAFEENQFNRLFSALIYFGSIITIPVIYSSIILGYFFNFNIKKGILSLLIAEVIIILLALLFQKALNAEDKAKT